ncbi:alpha/beta hydrolase [Rhizobium setariae]|uniref:alpha/beta hydrolase n=1 Tax=Rhizobium setariae TaxID=2801340 RepID=UPI0031BBB2AE
MTEDLQHVGVDRSRLLPELRRMLEIADALGLSPPESMSAIEARAASEIRLAGHWGAKDDVDAVETFAIPSRGETIRLRLYRKTGTARTILYFHGGGWVVGSLDTHDGALRALVHAAGANIVAVEYAKAPEHPFPACLDDALSALDWLLANAQAAGLDAERIIVAGDSAGASIAASLAVLARDRGTPLLGQVLVYPATDLTAMTPSRTAFAQGYFLSMPTMDWYVAHYLSGGTDPADPGVSPLRADDLANLPAALLVTADHDPLRDEGRAYAGRLIAAGNNVAYEEWRGTVHGFMIMDRTTRASRKLIEQVGGWCRRLWEGSDNGSC